MYGFIGLIGIAAIGVSRFRAGIDPHPDDFPFVVVCSLYSRIHDVFHDRRYIDAYAVSDDTRNDRPVRHVDGVVAVDGDRFAAGRHLNVVILHRCQRLS